MMIKRLLSAIIGCFRHTPEIRHFNDDELGAIKDLVERSTGIKLYGVYEPRSVECDLPGARRVSAIWYVFTEGEKLPMRYGLKLNIDVGRYPSWWYVAQQLIEEIQRGRYFLLEPHQRFITPEDKFVANV